MQTEEQIKVANSKGQPPEADKVILIDFDSTLYTWGTSIFDSSKHPTQGAVVFMQALKAAGYTIGIFTSRLSKKWLNAIGQTEAQHIAFITSVCVRDGIPFDFITSDKVPAEYYIDDKAIRFENNWEKIWVNYFEGVE